MIIHPRSVPQHIYEYAFVGSAECLEATLKGMKCDIKFKYRLAESYRLLQLRVSLRFAAPRYDTYCKIWDNHRYIPEGMKG